MGLFHRKKKDEDAILRSNHDDELTDSHLQEADDDSKKKKHDLPKFMELLLDSHHKIEKKAITFLSVFAIMAIGMTIGLVHNHRDVVATENSTTNLSSKVGWSMASTTFTLGKAWTTPNRSLVVIPITFDKSTFSQISPDASHYKIMMGTMDKYLKSRPKAQLVFFGNTNQAALVLQNVERFPSQVTVVSLRELKQLSDTDNGSADDADSNSDQSGLALQNWMNTYGKKHNVTYFKINPGATNVNVFDKDVSFKSLNLKYLYNTLYGNSERKKIEQDIANKQNDLTYQYRQMQAYEHTIDAAGYKVPANPSWVDNKWRPANMVNPDTGAANAQQDNAQQGYNAPQDLQRKDGHGMMQSDEQQVQGAAGDANNNNNNSNSSSDNTNFGRSGQAQQAQQALQSLTQVWTNIYNDKMQIYVNDNQALYNLKYTADQQRETATESLMKNFKLISPVKLSN